MVCSISGHHQLDSSISTLHPTPSCENNNKSLHIHCKCLWGVKINLHREPLIETFSHTEANWTLKLDKYKITFLTIWWVARCPLVNHYIYEKVWLQLEIFHEGKSIGNRTSFPKMQTTGLISHSWCSPVAARIQLCGKDQRLWLPSTYCLNRTG